VALAYLTLMRQDKRLGARVVTGVCRCCSSSKQFVYLIRQPVKSPSDKVSKAAMVLELCSKGVRELMARAVLLIDHMIQRQA
jgi:hypothetical protein